MTASAAARCDVGARVGPYRIVGELGGGGMGVVYRAVHTLLHRPAAVKVLRPELGASAGAVERFRAEACAAAAIRPPGVVEIYDYGYTAEGHAYIAMELLEGQTLGARLAERGRSGTTDALALVRRIAVALAAAHDRGVVHRDLKPENVFLVRGPDGGPDDIKLLDFGVAWMPETEAAERASGLIVGTPAYMSPEQCAGAAHCDHRSDFYALGCLLFELLTGQPPYGRSGATDELLAAHLRSPVPRIDRSVELPAQIERLVVRLLAKRAEDRPASARELIAEIADIERGLATAPAPRGACGLASRIASSFALLGARVRAWRSGDTLRGSAHLSAAASTAGGHWPRRSAEVLLTSAPTQPLIEVPAGRRNAAPTVPPPATELAGN
jgi:serine/threonine protein kinase